jgi:heme A synthase
MVNEPPLLSRLRGVARLCLPAMWVVVVASAFLRHHGASAALQAAWAGELVWARVLHRVAATAVLLGAAGMVVMAWRARHAAPAAARSPLVGALALLGVALLLSAVGVAGGASRAAPVVLLNLMGGLVMLALCAHLARDPAPARLGAAARWAIALMLLQASAGALAGAWATPGCDAWFGCVSAAWAHRGLGVLLALALSMLGLWALSRRGRGAGAWLALLGATLLVLGVLAAALGSAVPPWLAVLHNAAGAAALALLASEM